MKKLYIILPIIGCAVFAVFFWQFKAQYGEQERAKIEAKRIERDNKVKADFEAKRKAMEEAIAQQEKRKIEKAEREKREAEEKQMQIDLNDARDRARTELDRVLRQVDRLKNEIASEEAALKKLTTEKANLVTEEEFHQKYVKLAEANQKSLDELLNKIKKADDAAAIAAAQAGKKKS
jgi:phage-related minor tail protein